MDENFLILKEKIKQKSAKVGVIGLGYVGLPLALELSNSNYTVFGIDVNVEKINSLKEGKSYIQDVEEINLKKNVNDGLLKPTTDFSELRNLDAVSICVPTPLTKTQEPDMSYVNSAVKKIKDYMHKNLLIILESTTYPGTTEELIEKELFDEGYQAGKDYFLCFSPERVDPGNNKYNTKNTPKVIGGTTEKCTELGKLLYGEVINELVPVSSPKVAEMSKLLENTFRSINIAFINEMALLCDKLGIDIWETIEASSTKPFGFMPFYPGPGIGGHCIPLDPMYLSWKAKDINFYSRFIELAQETNKSMPKHILNKVSQALNAYSKPIKGSKILILGMAYKPNVEDLRESPSLDIYELLKENGAQIDYNDPYAKLFKDKDLNTVHSIDLEYDKLNYYDCVLLLTNHSAYNYEKVLDNAKLIVDTRNAFKKFKSSKVIKVGNGMEGIDEIEKIFTK